MAGVGGVGLREIAERAGLDVGVVRRLVAEVAASVAAGERVKLRGLGSLEARDCATAGAKTTLVRFTPAKPLRAAVLLRENAWHESRIGTDSEADTE